jgi:hypothetical protein
MLLKVAGDLEGLGGFEGFLRFSLFSCERSLRISLDFAQSTTATHQKEDAMKMYSRLFEPDLTHQLEATGVITGDAQDVATTHASLPGLLVRQVGGDVVNSVFDLDCGYGAGYILALHVAVDLPAFGIWGWKLDLPWEDPQFQWLTDPSEQRSLDNMYQVPGCPRLSFPREEVINHRRLLRRGHSLDGLLLGWGFESIPDTYRHGTKIEASLVLIDEMERGFTTPVQLWANRGARIDGQWRKKKTRPGLLEKLDDVMAELVRK